MAKTISSAFRSAWRDRDGQISVKRIRVKRRFFNGAAYQLESTFRTLPNKSETIGIGEIPWKLDTPKQNKFEFENATIFLDSRDGEHFVSVNSPSFWAADDTALVGYEPYKTLFQIQYGYRFKDGTEEVVAIFTGFLIDMRLAGKSGSAEITLSGKSLLLRTADAQNVNDPFTNEGTIATADPLVFLTTSEGVGKVSRVRAGAIEVDPGDYDISDLDRPGSGAKITFISVPSGSVDATGIKWKSKLKVEVLAGLLFDEAGILPADRTIELPTVPGGIPGSRDWTTKADWDAGILDDVETATSPGDVKLNALLIFDDFNDGSFLAPPRNWTVEGVDASWAVVSGELKHDAINSNMISTPSSQTTGTFEATMHRGAAAAAPRMVFMSTTGAFNTRTGYEVTILSSGIRLNRVSSGAITTILGPVGNGGAGVTRTYRVTRNGSGEMKLYQNGTLLGTVTDNTFTSSSFFAFSAPGGVSGTLDRFDTVKLDAQIIPGTGTFHLDGNIVTDSHDIGVTPLSFGILDHTDNVPAGTTLLYETASSDDDVIFDSFVAIGPGDQINSTPRRYFKVRISFTANAAQTLAPTLSGIKAAFATQEIIIELAIWTSLTVKDALELLAQIVDFEIGFEGDGKAFFRSKVVSGDPDETISQSDIILDLVEFNPGFDRVVNEGQVRHGNFFEKFGSTEAGEAEPTSERRFGKVFRFEDLSKILVANDSNIAKSRAVLIHDTNFLPKKVFRLKCRMTAQVDLADIYRLTFFRDPRKKDHGFGDPLMTWGSDFPAFGVAENVFARDLDCKIIGIKYRPDDREVEMRLEEIL